MRVALVVAFLMGFWGLLPPGVQAEEDLRTKVEMLERELNTLKEMMLNQQMGTAQGMTTVGSAEVAEKSDKHEKKLEKTGRQHGFTLSGLYIPERAEEFAEEGVSPQFGGIYTKPFLRRMGRNTYLGGYMDASYRATENSNNKFEVLRFVPFIYADVSDRVKMAAEIEFEHGGANTKHGDVGDAKVLDGEVKLEFATVDFLLRDEINLRAGLILAPLGKYNLVHDAPLQEFIDRPLVDRTIIPTTLTQAGMGIYGTFFPSELSKLTYEFYATNGFGNNITNTKGIRDARYFRYDRNNNNDPGVVGRVGFSPFLGLELGGSFFVNKYNRKDYFYITAFDFAFERGPFEFVGEGAYTDIGRSNSVRVNQPTLPPSMWGYYVEPRWHFMPEFIRDLGPNFFKEDSHLTAAARWDQVDTGSSRHNNRATVGLSFHYTEDTVFKTNYQWNMESGQPHVDNNAFMFGVATFF
ncbi:MAG: hypothetical protein V3V54_01460 [Candidatus Brocadiales bacterium]